MELRLRDRDTTYALIVSKLILAPLNPTSASRHELYDPNKALSLEDLH